MNNPFFSIIVPIYNAESYLRKTITSVLEQEYSNWELILINDGSSDKSINICTEFDDKRIKCFSVENGGVSKARNIGINKCSGSYIVFLDADDWLSNDYLTSFYNAIEEYNSDLLITNFINSSRKGNVKARKINELNFINDDQVNELISFSLSQSQWYKDYWYGNLRSVWGKCFKSSIIKINHVFFDSKLRYGEDMVFVLNYLLNCHSALTLNQYTYYYRIHFESAMNSRKWNGPEQGQLYYDAVYKAVSEKDNYEYEVPLANLWLETAESDWMLLSRSNLAFIEKRKEYFKLFNTPNYQYYSNKKLLIASQLSRKFNLYRFLIRNKLVIMLMIASRLRAEKHKNV